MEYGKNFRRFCMKVILSSIAALALLAGTAQAHHTQRVEATVTRVDPIYSNSTQHLPRQGHWTTSSATCRIQHPICNRSSNK